MTAVVTAASGYDLGYVWKNQAAKDGEKIVFTWQVWPDKDSFYAAEEKMHQDPRMDTAGEPPFDARRLILGCFEPFFLMGRG